MANLGNSYNVYANLAQSSYNNRRNNAGVTYNFVNGMTKKEKRALEKGKSIRFNFPNAKDAHGNDLSTVYLQPDTTVKTVKELGNSRVPKVNGGYEIQSYVKNTYKQGLLTDEKAGFNAYYVTDTPKLSIETKHTYFVTRGSDGISSSNLNLNDWWHNNQAFTTKNAYIPQAKLANQAMHQKITEMTTQAPHATMSVTGHSLGTMVSIQAVANLPEKDIAKIDKVVLFQGPDARESINKMSEQAQKNIQKLEEDGKIDYYVNAFDIVSMLNRNKPGVDEIGNVRYLLPKSFNTTFDMEDQNGSSHDFGQFQINPDGTLQEANLKEHGYIFAAGIKVSHLIDKYLNRVVKEKPEGGLSFTEVIKLLLSGEYKDFEKEYATIIAEAKVASEWNETVNELHKRISNASGSKKITLQSELVQSIIQKAKNIGEEYEIIFKNAQKEFEDEITAISKEILAGAGAIKNYLTYWEVQEMVSPYEKNNLWDSGQASLNTNQVKQYKEKLEEFSNKLAVVANHLTEYDRQAGNILFKNK
ncbi:lipase family protein [Enterococcus mundtii]|uniref:cutinase family protein n=1 Tax=Enterococcus TaxID=1350 RepID=UPI00129CEF4F|nr:cutinase family protein [Enterococcus mundtii]MRI73924.1 lipase family protein [Enterococcus mundtii]